MAELDYFPWRYRYVKKLEKLSDQELGRLVRALSRYGETGERQELAGRESIVFDFIADDIDAAKAAYEAKCNQAQANASGRKQTQAAASGRKQTAADAHTISNTNTIQDNSVCVNSISSNPAHAREDTHTPTRDEIHAFCVENGISIDEEKFFLTYSSNGWKDTNGNPVGDWRNRVLLWNHGDKERKATGGKRTANDNTFSTFDTDEFLGLALKRTFHEE